MTSLPFIFSAGWASGINAYATVLVLGLLGRFGGVASVPDGLQSSEVLIAAGALFAVEFVTDKVPYLDSAWDTVHTAIRPTVGAVLGLLIAGDSQSLGEATGASVGGGTALLSHMVKAGLRLAVNASPEPFSNIVLSLSEDFAVISVVSLALAEPWLAAAIAGLMLLIGLILLYVLHKVVLRLLGLHRRPGVNSS
jgi:hypothetical protein